MRRLFTTEDALKAGLTRDALRWGQRKGRWRRIENGVYGDGPEAPSPLDRARASVLATRGIACGRLAGVLHELDGITVRGPEVAVAPSGNGRRPGVRRRDIDPSRIVAAGGIPCTDGLQTLLDLAGTVSDEAWEQALESALCMKLTTIAEIEAAAPRLPGADQIRRVLALRPDGAAPTESFLETLMVQLARTVEGLPPPVRQFRVFDQSGVPAGRADLAWPELGLFIELDGEHHKGQPVYDANRETAIVAATGWLCARFTWSEVVYHPHVTARRLAKILAQARRRPVAS